ncbi:hypothetical protein HPG69_014535 [Diceros bicornis minor]|uniref:c-Myc-binding protein n=1 Tax=Diceros bicornis minor TaxID=77932 RepID=A0A7J7E3Q1_DICBM|nr:hypothetical protein HPG69_014535 [Diceros bicornis minor]
MGHSERPRRHENRPHPCHPPPKVPKCAGARALPRMSSAAQSPPATVPGASYAAAAVTMAHYKAADSKREQFRRYLEKSGVLDTLTNGEHGLGEGSSCPRRAPRRCALHGGGVGKEGQQVGPVRVLVALYEEPEKPNSALDFLKHHLGAATPENPEIELLRLELAEMKEKYEAILEENKKLKTKDIVGINKYWLDDYNCSRTILPHGRRASPIAMASAAPKKTGDR